MTLMRCSICGGTDFHEVRVLWPELVADWQLTDEEVRYIDRQQGLLCDGCHGNMRVNALGNAVRHAIGTRLDLRSAVASGGFDEWRILDLNGADGISTTLATLPHYFRADFPAFDMHNLPFADASFDLVIHSDTLEHVDRPIRALEECRRVLKTGHRLCFTVPVIVGRMTRGREGLKRSFHGDAATGRDDYLVHTEYGADVWTQALRAGFSDVAINQVEFPGGLALSAWVD